MRKRHVRRKAQKIYRDLVLQRIRHVYSLALEEARKGNIDYSAELGQYIKKLSRESGIRLPREIKRGICKRCGVPLIPGITARVRLQTQGAFSYIVITCVRCGWIHRYPYKKGEKTRWKTR